MWADYVVANQFATLKPTLIYVPRAEHTLPGTSKQIAHISEERQSLALTMRLGHVANLPTDAVVGLAMHFTQSFRGSRLGAEVQADFENWKEAKKMMLRAMRAGRGRHPGSHGGL